MANERLFQFPSKASPVPADIIYAGDSASAFNEVNITISALIGAYPNLLGIGNLTLGANTFPYSNNSATLTAGAISALGVSLVGGANIAAMQTTLGYTSTPTASQFAGWDVNSNLRANNFNTGYATTTNAGSTTTLTVASAQQEYFTGTLNQTVSMPVTSTLLLGQSWLFVNLSSGTITINSSGGNVITTLGANQTTRVTCISITGTTASSWSAATPVAGSGVVNSGTINNLAYYAATGSTVSALATSNSSALLTNGTGIPSWVAFTGSGAPVLGTGPALSNVLLSGGILDSNGVTVMATPLQVLPVNFFSIKNSATGVAPSISAQGSDTNINLRLNGQGTGGVQSSGTTSGSAISSGYIGQFLSTVVLNAAAVPIANNTAVNIATLSLPAGLWEFSGEAWVSGAGTGLVTAIEAGVSTTSATLASDSGLGAATVTVKGSTTSLQILQSGSTMINVTTTTIVYLVAFVTYTSTGTVGWGKIQAWRRG